MTPDYIEYLFKFDSTHGKYAGQVCIENKNLSIDGIKHKQEKNPFIKLLYFQEQKLRFHGKKIQTICLGNHIM